MRTFAAALSRRAGVRRAGAGAARPAADACSTSRRSSPTPQGTVDGAFYPGVTMTSACLDFCGLGSARPRAAPLACAYDRDQGRRAARRSRFSGAALERRVRAPQATVSLFVAGVASARAATRHVEALAGETVVDDGAASTPRAPFGRAGRRSPGADISSVACLRRAVLRLRARRDGRRPRLQRRRRSPTPRSSPLADGASRFAGNQPDGGFECSVDGARVLARAARRSRCPQLGDGTPHAAVAMIDATARRTRRPRRTRWTVAGPPVPQPAPVPRPLRTRTATACPTRATTARRCRTRPGRRRRRRRRRRLRGRLARHAGADRRRAREHRGRGRRGVREVPGRRRLKQSSPGFVPLKGQASVPVGTTVDARKGTVAMASAQNSQGTQRNARLSAGIFLIRQQRAKRGSAAVVGTDLVLQSAPGAEAACAAAARSGPIKGRSRNTVRSLTAATTKGLYRVIGGAAITTAPDATWVTRDRCDGTRTEVGRGPRLGLRPRGEDDRARARRALVPGQSEAVRGPAGRAMKVAALALLLLWRGPRPLRRSRRRRASSQPGQQSPVDEGGATIQQRVRRRRVIEKAAGTAAPYLPMPLRLPVHRVPAAAGDGRVLRARRRPATA